jgi:hypothetical protein
MGIENYKQEKQRYLSQFSSKIGGDFEMTPRENGLI